MSKMTDSAVRVLRSRLASFLGQSHSGARNLYETFGYPADLQYQHFLSMYLRMGIANRIVRAYPKATWRNMPLVRDEAGAGMKPKEKDYSKFAESVSDIFDRLGLLSSLERADRLAGIGHYGVLFLGFQDGLAADQPLESRSAPLLYTAGYTEENAKVQSWETDLQSPRYGRPKTYTLRTGSPVPGRMVATRGSLVVHHSRVIHIAEDLDEDDVFGTPSLYPVYNHLLDLEKVVGAGAETFWLNARAGLSLEAHPDAKFTEDGLREMKEQAEEFEHQLRRTLALQGVVANQLNAQVSDPKPNVDTLLDLIAGAKGIPKRILIGSERGELSSEQDENNWSERVAERRTNWASPHMIRPLVQMLIDTGNVPAPQGAWWSEWPDSGSLSPERRASVASTRSQALAHYANSPTAQIIVPPEEFRVQFLEMEAQPETDYDEKQRDMPLDETDPNVVAQFEGSEAVEPEQTALNGAQIASLKAIAEAVGLGLLPAETAVQLIVVGFPAVGEVQARRIVDPMDGFTPQQASAEIVANARRTVGLLRQAHANAGPRPLYVRRDVLNGEEILAHYQAQGVTDTLEADDLHVTVTWSRTPVDWMAMGESWSPASDGTLDVPAGGPRLTEMLGRTEPRRVLVLSFAAAALSYRHEEMRRAGASFDFPHYQPRVTIAPDWDPADAEGIVPWGGPILLGPEIFEEPVQGWNDRKMSEAAE